MKIFDPHTHMFSRVTDDYQRMAVAGIEAVCEPAFWLGNLRKHVATFIDYFDYLLEFETDRAANYGIKHYVTLAMNPKEANDRKLAKEVIEVLESYVDRDGVLAVGEIGLDSQTEAEEEALRAQLELAMRKKLPVVIHTPHVQKLKGTLRIIDICKEAGCDPDLVLIDHNTEETVKQCLDYGAWSGHTVYPVKLTPDRAANIVMQYGVERLMMNSSADWGESDPLSVPQTVVELRRRGYAENGIQQLVWDNPIQFYAQSGRKLDLEPVGAGG